MLQQTQVERVLPIYERFVKEFPDVGSLAGAVPSEVIRAWRGLGYNTRAVRLHRLARAVVELHGGEFPREREALVALPGVGAYTAAAIRAFAFEHEEVAVDTNVRRVVHRAVLGYELPRKAGDRELDIIARAGLPVGRAHDFNSALMDLGATICGARLAKCLVCPLRERCAAAPLQIPEAPSKRAALPFERTTRYLRGRVVDRLRELRPHEAISLLDLECELDGVLRDHAAGAVEKVIAALERDGVVHVDPRGISLDGG